MCYGNTITITDVDMIKPIKPIAGSCVQSLEFLRFWFGVGLVDVVFIALVGFSSSLYFFDVSL